MSAPKSTAGQLEAGALVPAGTALSDEDPELVKESLALRVSSALCGNYAPAGPLQRVAKATSRALLLGMAPLSIALYFIDQDARDFYKPSSMAFSALGSLCASLAIVTAGERDLAAANRATLAAARRGLAPLLGPTAEVAVLCFEVYICIGLLFVGLLGPMRPTEPFSALTEKLGLPAGPTDRAFNFVLNAALALSFMGIVDVMLR
eukprot:CAMPEP_0206025364 /NCGR_PEP_ID=MMETSP1464-20131121/39894_1 /ASSEMBLY_ACC=CAM_ASM_001124 /TAXON_ID=119497 /ORGANISM="Exanthemachrysis gayraliae, Strain RCC1523" /LENGTH=205 /DNA_ID=CAMNT_0053399399 /DNA_START=27 /DNA_END=640 /DNA_ORIENTATION=-